MLLSCTNAAKANVSVKWLCAVLICQILSTHYKVKLVTDDQLIREDVFCINYACTLMPSSCDWKPCPFAPSLQETGKDTPLSWQPSSSGYQLAPVTALYQMNEGWKTDTDRWSFTWVFDISFKIDIPARYKCALPHFFGLLELDF